MTAVSATLNQTPLPGGEEECVSDECLQLVVAEQALPEGAAVHKAIIDRIAAAIIGNEAEKIDQVDVATLTEAFKTEVGRSIFARTILELRRRPACTGKLSDVAYGLLGDLSRAALREAALQKDTHSPQLYLELAENFFRIFEGAEDTLMV